MLCKAIIDYSWDTTFEFCNIWAKFEVSEQVEAYKILLKALYPTDPQEKAGFLL